MREIHVFDLDGVLIDTMHRYRTLIRDGQEKIDLAYWRANSVPSKIEQDSLLPLAEFYRYCRENDGIYVIVATSRVMGDADLLFLKNRLGMPDLLINRRGETDTRKGYDLKSAPIRGLLNLVQFQGKPVHIWEDNREYLDGMCERIPNAIAHFIPSEQGH